MDTFVLLGTVVLVVLSITTHEAAHAWVADRLGDPTARKLGRVTLNPLPHIDPFMTVVLPGLLLLSGSPFLFGGARPVPVNLLFLRNRRRDWALVGAAGPISNILIGILCAALLALFLKLGIFHPESKGVQVLALGIYANALLAALNLIPIPPLDGSRVVMYFLRGEALRAYVQLERFGILILLGLFWFSAGFRALLQTTIGVIIQSVADLFSVAPIVANSLHNLFSA